MTRRSLLRLCAKLAPTFALPGCASQHPDAERPSILLLVADDLGLECLGAYGGISFSTPSIDALSREGMRFTNAFATPACAPSRAELLTGRYPFRTGWIDNAGPLSPRTFAASEPTFAKALRSAGYATAIAGKWQLGSLAERPRMPFDSGFDESCCWSLELVDGLLRMTPDNSRYFAPRLWQNGRRLAVDPASYGPEIEFQFLTDFIARNPHRPFLAYHAMNLPHAPYHAPPGQDAAKVRALGETERAAALYSMMVAYMDELVGRYVARLRELGTDRRTLMLFTSDNGGNENFVVAFAGRNVRGGKFRLDDTGANVPLIVHQPGTVPTRVVCEDLVDFTDIGATFADLAGIAVSIRPPGDGHSLRRPLRGEGRSDRDWVFCQLGHQGFIRDKHWRLGTDGRLFRVKGVYADEPADPATDPQARTAYRALRASLLGLLGADARRIQLAPLLVDATRA